MAVTSSFLVPAFVVVATLTFYPMIQLILMSLRDYHGSLVSSEFVGLKWYLQLFNDPRFVSSVARTAAFTSVAVVLQLALGMVSALILNRDFAGIRIVRTILILPMVAMPVASALMWSILFHPNAGVLNWLLQLAHLEPSLWLASPTTVLFPSLLIIETWLGSPFAMLVILAGLRVLPVEPFEAAEIDGASSIQRFWYITLPLVRPSIVTAFMFRLIDTMKEFPVIWVLTQGGPVQASETLYVYGYMRAFKYFDLGYGSAVLVAFVLIVIAISIVVIRVERDEE